LISLPDPDRLVCAIDFAQLAAHALFGPLGLRFFFLDYENRHGAGLDAGPAAVAQVRVYFDGEHPFLLDMVRRASAFSLQVAACRTEAPSRDAAATAFLRPARDRIGLRE
jgi:hypothetical protein